MYFLLLYIIPSIYASTTGEHNSATSASALATNDLGLALGHKVNKYDKSVTIYFDVSNFTLKEYRYYYYDFHPFGSYGQNEFLPRQRLLDTHNSLRIAGLHEGDYVSCVTFVDEYGTIFKPRYACYEFTLGEKIVGSHHGSKSGYLMPLLLAFAFVIHVFIAIVHHLKAKNYPHRLLHRFMDVTPKSPNRRINLNQSIKELNKELDHPHVSASVQRRLSRVNIDGNHENEANHGTNFDTNDEIPLYTIPHHSRTTSVNTMQVIPEYGKSDTLDSVSSMKHLTDTAPWIKRAGRKGPSHA